MVRGSRLETSAQLAEEREQRLEQLRTERLRLEELREELQRRCKALGEHGVWGVGVVGVRPVRQFWGWGSWGWGLDFFVR